MTAPKARLRPPSSRSNSATRLTAIAADAGALYRAGRKADLACAAKLLEARRIATHGEWGVFLERAGIPDRTARRLIAYARAGVQIGHLADLGQADCDRAIAQIREDIGRWARIADTDRAQRTGECLEAWDRWHLSGAELMAKEWQIVAAFVDEIAKLAPTAREAVLSR